MGFGRRLAVALARPRPPRGLLSPAQLDEVKRLVVVRAHDQLGDFLLVTPAIRALRQRFPRAHLTLVVNEFLAPLALYNPDADRVVVAPWKRSPRDLGDLWRVRRDLGVRPYDLAVVLNTVSHSLTSDLVARFSGAGRVAGPTRPELKDTPGTPLYDWALEPGEPASPHQMDRAVAAVAALGVPEVPRAYRFHLTPEERDVGLRLRHSLPDTTVIGLHVGTRDAAKRYPIERWIELVDAVSERHGAHFVVLDAPDAREATEEIARRMRAPHARLSPLTLREVAGVLSCLDLVLCHDSALLHLAAAVGTPTVSIHGRGAVAEWRPPGERHVALQAPDHRPESITVEDALAAVGRALSARAAARPGG